MKNFVVQEVPSCCAWGEGAPRTSRTMKHQLAPVVPWRVRGSSTISTNPRSPGRSRRLCARGIDGPCWAFDSLRAVAMARTEKCRWCGGRLLIIPCSRGRVSAPRRPVVALSLTSSLERVGRPGDRASKWPSAILTQATLGCTGRPCPPPPLMSGTCSYPTVWWLSGPVSAAMQRHKQA